MKNPPGSEITAPSQYSPPSHPLTAKPPLTHRTPPQLFEEMEKRDGHKESKLGKRGTMNDITYVRQGSNDSVPRSPGMEGKVLGFMDR